MFQRCVLPATSLRRVVLLALDWIRDKDPRTTLGHASLLAALVEAGDVDVVSRTYPVNVEGFDPKQVVDDVLPDLVGHSAAVDLAVGAYVWNEPAVQSILRTVRAAGFRGRIVVGGPQVSYAGPGLEQIYPHADVFVRGYGERALVQLVRSEQRKVIEGVHWAGTHDQRSVARPELAQLPSPYTTGAIQVLPGQRFLRAETQRGCPYRCSFCQHREPGHRLRRTDLDAGRVQEELRLFGHRGVQDLAILDPIFNVGRNHGSVLRTLREAGFSGRVSVQARFELLDDAFLEGCDGLNIVPEFGLQTIHRDEQLLIRRPNDMGRVERAIEALQARDRPFEVSLIYGLPGQTYASFEASVDWLLARGVPCVRAFPLMLLRGTELDEQRDEFALVESDDPIPVVVASRTFDAREHARMAELAAWLEQTVWSHPYSVRELMRCVA
ncbi:MAG: radical SAM protein [Polyangiaceae bacterium]|nr:radical SAM protein [Polyangiaceae bacterium]